MARKSGVEGTVKETPRKGSGSWIALLPPRLCQRGQRTSIPGRFPNKTLARRALSAHIADIDNGRLAAPSGRPGGPVRRVRHSVEDYIAFRTTDPRAPLAGKTIRGYKSVLTTTIIRPDANIGEVAIARLTPLGISNWMDDLTTLGVGQPTINAARRLLSAALSWEVNEGRLAVSPFRKVRITTSKFKRASDQPLGPVLLPTWSELAKIVQTPQEVNDRILIALMAWAGLRWSEAISLEARSVWKDKPAISISRVLSKSHMNQWVSEPPKAGQTATVPIPRQLWERLRILADERLSKSEPNDIAGNLLFRSPVTNDRAGSIGIMDHSNFRRNVWIPARQAAGLDGDPTRPTADPRSRGLRVKDLRAFAASVLADAGATAVEIAVYLRHSDIKVTATHYLRAFNSQDQDPARMQLRIDQTLSTAARLDALWEAWTTQFPEAAKALRVKGTKRTKKVAVSPDRAINRATVAARPPAKKKKIAQSKRKTLTI